MAGEEHWFAEKMADWAKTGKFYNNGTMHI